MHGSSSSNDHLIDTVDASADAASVAPAVPTGIAAGLQASNGATWYMTMTVGSATTPPTFSCSP